MNGKVALITGSSSGIGRATAILFSKLGAKVLVTGVESEEVVNEVTKCCDDVSPYQYKAVGVVADLTKDEDAQRLLNATIEHFGKIDILVNCAGMMRKNFIEDPQIMEAYESVFDTNVRSTLLLCHLSVPYLEKTNGCIIIVSSIRSTQPAVSKAVYCMSKAALSMLTNCLALELGPKGIRVNSVKPSFIRTNMTRLMRKSDEQFERDIETFAQICPLKRVGEPDDVAKAIAFLASEDASFVTGTELLVDGGSFYLI